MTEKARKYRKELRGCINELTEHELRALLTILQEVTQSKEKEPIFARNDLTYGSLKTLTACSEMSKKVVEFMYAQELYDYMQTTASFTGANLLRFLTMLNENQAADYKMRAVQFEPKPYKD